MSGTGSIPGAERHPMVARPAPPGPRAGSGRRAAAARRGRFALLCGLTALVLAPLLVVLARAVVVPGPAGSWPTLTADGVRDVLASPTVRTWLGNSAAVTAVTVVATLLIASPAGYALSRGRGRALSGCAMTIFLLQSVPILLLVVPLFVLLARLGLVDSLPGLTLVLVGLAVPVAVWMLAACFDSIPIALEEAAWLDGLTVFGGFRRIVLRTALPGVLSTAVFTFLLAWNDYLIAVVLIRSDASRTLGIGLVAGGGAPALALVAVLPPVIVFVVLHRRFRAGGVGGALAGT